MTPKLTVLTPLYNRNDYIERLYYCLCSQTSKDFNWLVIDDGSSVSSEEKFSDFSQYSDFSIKYIYKENGGKHTALNHSHQHLESDWVLILDSDDILTSDAVETVLSYIEKYGDDESIGILSFQRGSDKGTPFVKFNDTDTVSDHIQFRINENRPGDCCEVIRASVLKEFPFPVFVGEKYINESHLWIGSADRYKTVYIPKIIYICEYIDNGLTKSGRSFWRTCPKGGMHSQIVGLNKRCSLKYRIKRALLLHYYGRILNMKVSDICKDSGHPAFVRLFTLPGFILYKRWEKKYNTSEK